MRSALVVLVTIGFILVAAPTAAQTNAIPPNVIAGLERAPILDGVWRVNGLGDLTLATRPNEVLEGSLNGRACGGQYRGNAFSVFCEGADRGPYLISGQASLAPRENSTARSRVFAQPARMSGQIHQSYLTARGHTEEIAALSATRQ
ncbi:MAG: hypothetical protein JNL81_02865 [Hyphomonadaceae bacterium]|nr:hypothetical protein [Hyphomonadaceae bacterium]